MEHNLTTPEPPEVTAFLVGSSLYYWELQNKTMNSTLISKDQTENPLKSPLKSFHILCNKKE